MSAPDPVREQGSERMMAAHDYWFRRGLLRHLGLMNPDMVADAVAKAVTLPPAYQYEVMSVIPTAPIGELPEGYQDYVEGMMRRMPPS